MAKKANKKTREDLEKEVEALRADVGRLTETLQTMAKQANPVQTAKNKVYSLAEKAGQTAREYNEQAQSAVEERYNQFENRVEEDPVKATLYAAGIGAIFGILTSGLFSRN